MLSCFSIGLNYRKTLYIKLPLGAFLKCINQCFLEKASNSSFPLLLRMRLEMLCTANLLDMLPTEEQLNKQIL